jgi:predicted metalloprotease with PDZ domain
MLSKMQAMTDYRLNFADPAGHLIDIEMTIPSPIEGQRIAMPSWIPGSYLMREFARHVVTLSAEQSGSAVSATKLDKSTWQFACVLGAPLRVSYRIYAWDRSVRGCYFDGARGFVNPAAALMQNLAQPDAPCTLTLYAPTIAETSRWRCATAMTAVAIDAQGFGDYGADSYDELIDHPIECGEFDEFSFDAGGVAHRFVISGQHRGDLLRLKLDAQKICQGHCDLFDPSTPSRAPFDHYLFQLHVVDEGYGGLEHRASTALIAPRNDLPALGDATVSEGYRDLLGLISHEYFHAWNVKRIKPAAFTPYNTAHENYTRLLWLFEGFTSYYDDLMVKRVGLITEADYLKVLGRRLTQLLRAPGARLQSAADASWDAWIKYYRADENAPNSQFSYYLRGSFVALALDLMLRERAASDITAPTLDDVMRGLWRSFGSRLAGVPEDACALFSELTQMNLGAFFAQFVNGTADPDWATLLAPFGIHYHQRVTASASDRGGRDEAHPHTNVRALGLILSEGSSGLPVIKHVISGSAASSAGLSAGDTWVAIDGLRASTATLAKHLPRFAAGDTVDIDYFRHDQLQHTMLHIAQAKFDTVWLSVASEAAPSPAAALRQRWLGTALR